MFHKPLLATALCLAFLVVCVHPRPAAAQTFNVIHTFLGPEGATPTTGLTMDTAGNFYGATAQGGINGQGVVFKLYVHGSAWLYSPLYKFTAGADGYTPEGRVVFGPDGPLYGTVYEGGAEDFGVVYKLQPSPTPPHSTLTLWNEKTLYTFRGGSDGAFPISDLVFRGNGLLYGVTSLGGQGTCTQYGCGTVYKLTEANGAWNETIVYSFAGGSDGGLPDGIVFDSAGNIFGTTDSGGDGGNHGTVFQMTPSGAGWTESIIHRFQPSTDGVSPSAAPILDNAGNLYGSTFCSGPGGGGTVFELTPSNGNWVFNVIHSFTASCTTGPRAALTMDAAGNLYGTTYGGGAFGQGSVFKLTPGSGTWTFTSLHDFTGGSDGSEPEGKLLVDANGNIYGTASAGGTGCSAVGCGVIFQITP